MTTKQKNTLGLSVAAGLIVAATIWFVTNAFSVPSDLRYAQKAISDQKLRIDSLCKTKVDKEVLELKLKPVVEDIAEIKSDVKEIRNDIKFIIKRGK